VSLRWKFYIYFTILHLILAAFAVLFLSSHKIWFIALEGAFFLSLITGIWLVRALFEPIKLIQAGIDFIRENEFSTRFNEVKSPEMDSLISVYNQMIDNLRSERIRNREQENFLKDVIANSPSGIITLDLNERIKAANPSAAKLLGFGTEELEGQSLPELGTEFARELGSLLPYERKLIRLQGRRRVKCQKLTFMDRGFQRPFLLLDELTEELHKSEKTAYGKLVRMMSHEVNNTVGAVNSLLQSSKAYSDQIQSGDSDDFQNAINVAISRNTRMNDFMQGFAEVVRLPAPKLRPYNIQALLEDISILMREKCEKQRIELVWQVDEELPLINLDPTQMEQVFINVIQNAIEAIDVDGRITIIIGKRGGRPRVAIRNSGPPIPHEVMDQLFTPFFTTKADGQGIGLTMVQEILLAHEFNFSLMNLPEGGCEFLIYPKS